MVFDGPHSYASSTERRRRRYPRAPLQVSVILRIGDSAGSGTATNVSEGGLCVKTPSPAELGQEVWILLEIDGEALEANAEIVHGDQRSGYGLRFTDVEPTTVDAIRRYVATRMGATGGEMLN